MSLRLIAAAALAAGLAAASGALAQTTTVVIGSDPHTGGPTSTDSQTVSDIQDHIRQIRNQPQH